ncbi:Fur-regulated basic protein FbpA [Halobacillus ihumii]|uniref:Fur-regulated basic protein FbpA n=1 Tax=Halobacillus ihumii TaxID=2686092 RepID=UPI0013D069DC|nr:Fur-regulated basic protein FbpA [Halobacillus ihumii]
MILSRAVDERKNYLIQELAEKGYVEDFLGKKTEDMTLTELEEIHINIRCKEAGQ